MGSSRGTQALQTTARSPDFILRATDWKTLRVYGETWQDLIAFRAHPCAVVGSTGCRDGGWPRGTEEQLLQ